ncbi:AmmeMemoRadiSam system radical SAM enzyme [Pelotomaculum terephthalicicum JT]|uniref:AmmeMemoRadiSam system radical SAM enzyme n=1 Tax=Pelotomaculum TaxID=191373 RepID=UPI0009C7F14B|nr:MULTISPECIES: AmmeMemoRadiSam system radical SAM enzyme [Pelotomaculum]MCG9968618.1 AmmeMemoRadiSam system radical SAM enzyme [Pelotomaculum terephthalicicum JT]OPX85242.1 MAG: 4-hydroxyphenylacetate decarboxylase activating enzyme [Pelotomaculum sp. PtaB.Bin117]OPY62605.1 MAG: 4-hydroxyphenylacetate decarboxylase activating enzyme [Pelotomaculum sp. PtaU1.Bin065]
MREALFYEKKEQNLTACRLCPKLCTIREDKAGFCRVRENRKGKLYAANYGKVTSYGLDPIEKKPLYHFYPGSLIMSFGTVGCNLRCGFCQNWSIAHGDPDTAELTPEQAVEMARRQKEKGYPNAGIAYTYSEPFMWYEFVLDTARLAGEAGLKNVLVTNGYINETPLREILPYIDAMNIDIKGFTGDYYRNYCVGRLEPVLRTVEIACAQKCHVELTNLLVTGLNDSSEEIERLVDWIAALDREIPLHFSRYFPNFEMDLPATPLKTLKRAGDIARKKLSYVYIGNARELDEQDTCCPECGNKLISRTGYTVGATGLDNKRCRYCGRRINIVGDIIV